MLPFIWNLASLLLPKWWQITFTHLSRQYWESLLHQGWPEVTTVLILKLPSSISRFRLRRHGFPASLVSVAASLEGDHGNQGLCHNTCQFHAGAWGKRECTGLGHRRWWLLRMAPKSAWTQHTFQAELQVSYLIWENNSIESLWTKFDRFPT